MSYCINCGMKLADGVRFCTGCGTSVPSAEATEVSPPQNEPIETTAGQTQAPTLGASAEVVQSVAPVPQPVYTPPAQQPTVPVYPVAVPAGTPVYTSSATAQQPRHTPPATSVGPVYAAGMPNVQGVEPPPPAGSRYAPVTTGGFIGIFLLMLIPVVNFILLIVWACGGCRKVNKTNLARAMLVLMLLGAALALLVGLVAGLFFSGLGGLDGLEDLLLDRAMDAAGE